ncbi:MAG: lipoyl(octanoyl) transferase LipB [Candidatus Marinimicrobia bacterium]|nr:lipoyl(octanoyl) transferase LipB [Candidatus Neomarinimicrobiota bacterium]
MSLNIIDLGKCSYKVSLEQQIDTHSKVLNQELTDTIVFVEHEPVYTLGKNADQNNILTNYPKDVKIYNIDRGGDVTYHGPGQLVGYPIINIKNLKMSIGRYVHTLEEILINALSHFNISAQRRDKIIGIWIGDEKIGAIGVRVKNGVTMHGFALNVNTDLSYFDGIIPCGIDNCKVTSMEQLLRKNINLKLVKEIIIKELVKYFN